MVVTAAPALPVILRPDHVNSSYTSHGVFVDLGRQLVQGLFRNHPSAEPTRMWPLSTRVNKPENDDPTIVEPVELTTDAA